MDTVIDEKQGAAMAAQVSENEGDWGGALDTAFADDSGSGSQATPTPASAAPAQPAKAVAKPDDARQAAPKGRVNDLPPDDGAQDPEPVKPKTEPAKVAAAEGEAFKGTPKQLREAYELTKREKAELERKVKELSDARSSGTAAEVEKATKALRDEMDGIKKAHDETQAELRFARYTRSAEYKERFQKPLEKAYTDAMADLEGITMVDESGNERAVDYVADLEPIINAPAAKAWQIAKATFGDAAPQVMQHRNAIARLQSEAKAAIEDYRKNGAEHERRMEEQARISREQAVQKWSRELESVVSERPSLFSKPKDDSGLAKAWDDGDAIVNAALLGKMPDGVGEEERGEFAIQAQAQVAARARAFGVLAHRVHRLNSENRKLQERIKALEGSEPSGASRRTQEPSSAKAQGWEAALESM